MSEICLRLIIFIFTYKKKTNNFYFYFFNELETKILLSE
jgi:hypothetical protein